MIKSTIKQAVTQLKQHSIISTVSVIGTALAIFLIMLVVMMQQVKTAPFAPESNRDRFLHGHYLSIGNKEWGEGATSNGPMSVQTAKELWQSLKTPEAVTIYGTTLEWSRLLLCGGISFLLIALMIAIGIGIPARKAMKIDPAEVLHDE